MDPDALEDLYLPYKPRKASPAQQARDAGLQPLADWIWDCGQGTATPEEGQTLSLWAFTFRNEEKGIVEAEAAIAGARAILVERLTERADLRALVRKTVFEKGFLAAKKGEKARPHSKYESYFSFHEPVRILLEERNSHRYLAARRGAAEGELLLSIVGAPSDSTFVERLQKAFEAAAVSLGDSPGAEVLREAARSALLEGVLPAIEIEAHRALKDVADRAAIQAFAENVRRLLLAPPLGPKPVVGLDAAHRPGWRVARVDGEGVFCGCDVVPVDSDEAREHARKYLVEAVRTLGAAAVAVGNGAGGREAEIFARGALREAGLAVPVILVNEAAASVYASSDAGRDEFLEMDPPGRSAVSLARRLQDPLAELVKIDPKSVGVGQYQHEVSGRSLKRGLDEVIESCVSQVGVRLNTAHEALLQRVAGFTPAHARAIVDHRRKHGAFASRSALREVPELSTRAFEQAISFLRVPDSAAPLDSTGIHPETLPLLEGAAARAGLGLDAPGPDLANALRADKLLEEALGAPTLADITAEFERKGKDPRGSFLVFSFRDDVREVKDLKEGMACPGLVTNVTNFGAFIDIGVGHDGLVHLSEFGERFVPDPRKVVSPGDRVNVRILKVDNDKKQISLTMKRPPRPKVERHPRPTRPQPAANADGAVSSTTRPAPPRPPRREVPRSGASTRPSQGASERPRQGAAGTARQGSDEKPRRSDRPTGRPPGGSGASQPRPESPRDGRPPRPRPAESRPASTSARPVFNNPFAVLATLKGDLKKKS